MPLTVVSYHIDGLSLTVGLGTCEASIFDSSSNRPFDSIRFESGWPIRKFSNRIGHACPLLVVGLSLDKRLKPLTALSGTVGV